MGFLNESWLYFLIAVELFGQFWPLLLVLAVLALYWIGWGIMRIYRRIHDWV